MLLTAEQSAHRRSNDDGGNDDDDDGEAMAVIATVRMTVSERRNTLFSTIQRSIYVILTAIKAQ